MKRLCHYISEYMGALVLAAAVLALAFPEMPQQVPTKTINYLLGVVMFGMGLTLNLKDFKIVFSRPKDVIKGLWPKFTEQATDYLPAFSSIAIATIVAIVIGANASKLLAGGLVIVVVGMQNSGLASSLATLHFAAYPMATIPGAIFSVWHNISGATIARLYARNDKRK